MGDLRLTGLHIYPLKSAAGISLPAARVDDRGLLGDRRWMVVDLEGSFLTQRTQPRLALVTARPAVGELLLSAPGMPPLAVAVPAPDVQAVEVRVWDDTCAAAPAGNNASVWLSTFLGVDCALVYMPDATVRAVPPRGSAPPSRVGFADAYPALLLSEASLADLNARLARPVPMDRFRPNLVVAGCAPYAEDGWRRIRIGGVLFHVVKPCSRCTITTVDQATGERGQEPLATLARYRRDGNQVLFGQNLVHEGIGELRVGDAVEVLEPV